MTIIPCPYCGELESKVRSTGDENRTRSCLKCGFKYDTQEKLALTLRQKRELEKRKPAKVERFKGDDNPDYLKHLESCKTAGVMPWVYDSWLAAGCPEGTGLNPAPATQEEPPPVGRAHERYLEAGGDLSFQAWLAVGQPEAPRFRT